jgi:hypothetical protein
LLKRFGGLIENGADFIAAGGGVNGLRLWCLVMKGFLPKTRLNAAPSETLTICMSMAVWRGA